MQVIYNDISIFMHLVYIHNNSITRYVIFYDLLTSVIFVTVKLGPVINGSMTAITLVFGVFMDCLELLVAFIQAYVFTMLSAVFIGLSRQEEHV